MTPGWHQTHAGSVTRRVDLATPWATAPRARDSWRDGDVVVVEVVDRPMLGGVLERTDGRMAAVALGDHVVGVLGTRHATLEAVGTWQAVAEDGRMHLMTSAGLLGRVTSLSPTLAGRIVGVRYAGHVLRDGRPVRLADTLPPATGDQLDAPVVLVIGTSMSSGKTTAGRAITRLLKQRGFRVVAAKLVGAGRYKDILTMGDAGADAVLDFVDAGLASTVVPRGVYAERLERLLEQVAAAHPDVVVAEAGASPLEPYNGEVVMERLHDQVVCTVLCASDPYAVAGVVEGFGRGADLVSGPAVNTEAGAELVERLTGLATCNVMDPATLPTLAATLDRCGLARPG